MCSKLRAGRPRSFRGTVSGKVPGTAAFTLMELLVVIAVMAVLLGVSAIPISELMRSRGVAGAVDAASGLVTGARIEAMKSGRPVRVVIDTDPANKDTVFRRMGVVRQTTNSSVWEFAGRSVLLPTGVFYWKDYELNPTGDMKVNFKSLTNNGTAGTSVTYFEYDGRGQLASQGRMVFASGFINTGGQLEVPASREAGRLGFILRKSGRVTHYRSADEITK